jgi:uncharacterized protein YgiM (DUF1202 family)
MPERIVRVTKALPASTRASVPPYQARPHDRVTVLERSAEWPAFVLVRTSKGECGWVPERYLGGERPRTHLRRAYDTTSLEPAVGETLTVLEADVESGWVWCRDADHRTGWYPLDYVDEF